MIEGLNIHSFFQGISDAERSIAFECFSMNQVSYKKNEIMSIPCDGQKKIGLILSGIIKIVIEDSNGNTFILEKLFKNDFFGEAFTFTYGAECPFIIHVVEDTRVLFFDYKKFITRCPCSRECDIHIVLRKNVIELLVQKSLVLHRKIEILSKRTICLETVLTICTKKTSA